MAEPRVLVVAYWFPPAGGIAVQRALSLAKYLPRYGCEVHVLAPRNPPSPVNDPALLAQIPPEVQVHRAWTPMPPAQLRNRLWSLISRRRAQSPGQSPAAAGRPGRLSNLVRRLLNPDPEVVWVPFAVSRARRIVKKYGIDAVLVTAPPFSAFLIGNALKREFPALRLISDFRDEWLRFFLSTFEFQQNAYVRHRAETIERATIESSSMIVSITPTIVAELRQRYADHAPGKFVCIPNGYDPAIFASFRSRVHESPKVVITYVGTVYKATSPRFYFEALDALPQAARERIETRFVGRIAEDQRELVESRTDARRLGYIPQAEALRWMEETDFLLLVMTDPSFATGKIYEYLATGKPIIAFSPPGGEVAQTLAETGGGWCIDPGDSQAARECLEQAASGALASRFHPDREAIRRYERPRLAGEFAAVLRGASLPAPVLEPGKV